jgi:hypothetical protein
MSRDARQMTTLRPSPIAIHDYGDVLRQPLQIEFIEEQRLLEAGILQKFSGFHKISLKDEREEKLAQGFMARKDGAARVACGSQLRRHQGEWVSVPTSPALAGSLIAA